MKAIYNSRILPVEKISLEIHNRAFCYGDGLFETIVTGHDRINLLDYHMNRLTRAGSILDIEIPFDTKLLGEMIDSLKSVNNLSGQTLCRLQVWRNAGGLYEPDNSSSSFLLTIAPSDRAFYERIESISVSKNAHVTWHALSFTKSMSAMPYVVAGLERKSTNYSDLIICDGNGNMAECIVSNIFWTKGSTVFTPSLTSGCVSGTMRNHLIDRLADKGTVVEEVLNKPEELLNADSVFLTNAAGVQWVSSFEDKKHFQEPKEFVSQIIKLPQQP